MGLSAVQLLWWEPRELGRNVLDRFYFDEIHDYEVFWTWHNDHRGPGLCHSTPGEPLHWTCKAPPPLVLQRSPCQDWQERKGEVVFDSLEAFSVHFPTSWCSLGCGLLCSWYQSPYHICSKTPAYSFVEMLTQTGSHWQTVAIVSSCSVTIPGAHLDLATSGPQSGHKSLQYQY